MRRGLNVLFFSFWFVIAFSHTGSLTCCGSNNEDLYRNQCKGNNEQQLAGRALNNFKCMLMCLSVCIFLKFDCTHRIASMQCMWREQTNRNHFRKFNQNNSLMLEWTKLTIKLKDFSLGRKIRAIQMKCLQLHEITWRNASNYRKHFPHILIQFDSLNGMKCQYLTSIRSHYLD